MFTRKFWEQAVERAIRAMAYFFITAGTGASVLKEVNWAFVGSGMLMMCLLSIAGSLVGTLKGDPDDPSLLR